jgi:hypothetical protein
MGLPPEITQGQSQKDQSDTPHNRALDNLQNNQVASAGLSHDELAAMFANPYSRPLAQAYVQKQLDPGSYTFQQVGDMLVRTNSRSGQTDVVMRDTKPTVVGDRLVARDQQGNYVDVTPGGYQGKEQRERDARYADAISRGKTKQEADYYAMYGKAPGSEDLKPADKKMIGDNESVIKTGLDALDNLEEMSTLSKTAYEGAYATKRAELMSGLGSNAPQAALDTIRMQNLAMQNIAQQAKTLFGARILKSEINLMKQIETLPEQPDRVRQQILTQLRTLIQHRVASAQETNKAIKSGEYWSKDYTPTYGRSPAGAAGGGLEAEMRKRNLLPAQGGDEE